MKSDQLSGSATEPCYDIYWGIDQRTTNLHGAELVRQWDGSVDYENPLLASGIPIHRWTSKIRFQARSSATLPLLEESARYEVKLVLSCEPAQTVFLEFDFYNRSDQRIGTEILTTDGTFVCPRGMYYYEMKLVQGGSTKVHFDHIHLQKMQ